MTFDLKLQKRLAATVLKASEKRVKFDSERLNDIKAAITKQDIRALIAEGVITELPLRGISRARARKTARQKSKGLRKGSGSRKGGTKANSKGEWMSRIRAQRDFISMLKEKKLVDNVAYRDLYSKAKGGFFRNVRHIKIYINERDVVKKKGEQ